MRPRSNDVDYWVGPGISSMGSLHALDDQDPAPRLWAMKSVSRKAAVALDRRPHDHHRPAGFYRANH